MISPATPLEEYGAPQLNARRGFRDRIVVQVRYALRRRVFGSLPVRYVEAGWSAWRDARWSELPELLELTSAFSEAILRKDLRA